MKKLIRVFMVTIACIIGLNGIYVSCCEAVKGFGFIPEIYLNGDENYPNLYNRLGMGAMMYADLSSAYIKRQWTDKDDGSLNAVVVGNIITIDPDTNQITHTHTAEVLVEVINNSRELYREIYLYDRKTKKWKKSEGLGYQQPDTNFGWVAARKFKDELIP